MSCLENIIVLSTMFIVLIAIQTTKTEGNFQQTIFYLFWRQNEGGNMCVVWIQVDDHILNLNWFRFQWTYLLSIEFTFK